MLVRSEAARLEDLAAGPCPCAREVSAAASCVLLRLCGEDEEGVVGRTGAPDGMGIESAWLTPPAPGRASFDPSGCAEG